MLHSEGMHTEFRAIGKAERDVVFRGGLSGIAISVLVGHTLIAAQPPGSSSTVVTHALTVSRFIEVRDFTERDAQDVIADMGHILRTDDDGAGPNDVGCEVNFILAGSVETFTAGTGAIFTRQHFQEIIGLPGDVKVVEDIGWCENVASDGYAGCSDGSTFVVEAGWDLDTAGPLWAHEFGHVRGLGHRQGEPKMIMNSIITRQSRQVDRRECRQYR